ncbi:MAG: SCP-2 family sterol carrier protein [Chloroflexi bacterium]|jgi:putative sterol carrier protein|nr:SCP-2 family sterol carrier protein [Chloroflexota bacterium]
MADLNSIFANMGDRFQADKAGDLDLTIFFDLTGDSAAQWHASIANGELSYGEGSVDSPTATLSMDADEFEAMSKGELNPMMAFMSGKIKVDGDLNAVMKFQSLVGL